MTPHCQHSGLQGTQPSNRQPSVLERKIKEGGEMEGQRVTLQMVWYGNLHSGTSELRPKISEEENHHDILGQCYIQREQQVTRPWCVPERNMAGERELLEQRSEGKCRQEKGPWGPLLKFWIKSSVRWKPSEGFGQRSNVIRLMLSKDPSAFWV